MSTWINSLLLYIIPSVIIVSVTPSNILFGSHFTNIILYRKHYLLLYDITSVLFMSTNVTEKVQTSDKSGPIHYSFLSCV